MSLLGGSLIILELKAFVITGKHLSNAENLRRKEIGISPPEEGTLKFNVEDVASRNRDRWT